LRNGDGMRSLLVTPSAPLAASSGGIQRNFQKRFMRDYEDVHGRME